MNNLIDIFGSGYLTSLNFVSCRKCEKSIINHHYTINVFRKQLLETIGWIINDGLWYCPDCAPKEEEKDE